MGNARLLRHADRFVQCRALHRGLVASLLAVFIGFTGSARAMPVALLLNGGVAGPGQIPGPLFLTLCRTNVSQNLRAPCDTVYSGIFQGAFDVGAGDFDGDGVEDRAC